MSGAALVPPATWALREVPRLSRFLDTDVVDGTFDKGCEEIYTSGGILSRVQIGRVQAYLSILALAIVALAAILIWSSRA